VDKPDNVIRFRLHPRQLEVLQSPANEQLYGGGAGSGKSALARFAAIIFSLQIPGLQSYLFRRTYPELIATHFEGPSSFYALLAPLASAVTVGFSCSCRSWLWILTTAAAAGSSASFKTSRPSFETRSCGDILLTVDSARLQPQEFAFRMAHESARIIASTRMTVTNIRGQRSIFCRSMRRAIFRIQSIPICDPE
jgi:hypothetical protein